MLQWNENLGHVLKLSQKKVVRTLGWEKDKFTSKGLWNQYAQINKNDN
jgi:hypothetical protein